MDEFARFPLLVAAPSPIAAFDLLREAVLRLVKPFESILDGPVAVVHGRSVLEFAAPRSPESFVEGFPRDAIVARKIDHGLAVLPSFVGFPSLPREKLGILVEGSWRLAGHAHIPPSCPAPLGYSKCQQRDANVQLRLAIIQQCEVEAGKLSGEIELD